MDKSVGGIAPLIDNKIGKEEMEEMAKANNRDIRNISVAVAAYTKNRNCITIHSSRQIPAGFAAELGCYVAVANYMRANFREVDSYDRETILQKRITAHPMPTVQRECGR